MVEAILQASLLPCPQLSESSPISALATSQRRLPSPSVLCPPPKTSSPWWQVTGSPAGHADISGIVGSSAPVPGLAACDMKMWDAVFKGFWSVMGLKKKKEKKRGIGQKRGKMLTCNMYFYYTFLKNRVTVKLLKTLTFFLNRNPYLTVLAFIKFCSLVPGSFIYQLYLF